MEHPNPSEPDSSAPRLPANPAEAPLVVPVIEERAVITREVVERGRVRLTKDVHEHNEQLDLTLQHDEVNIERVPVNEFVADGTPPPAARQEGDTLIVPVLREVVVTRTLVVEEIRVTKRAVTEPHTATVPLRREEVRIDRLPPADA